MLRLHATPQEQLLWYGLRLLKKEGFHFRRQAPMRRYILDFVCHSAKLVIELDGSQHGDARNLQHDARRTALLKSQGYRVLRFWNDEVFARRDDMIAEIRRALEAPPAR